MPRHNTPALIDGGLTLDQRLDQVRVATHEAHTRRIAECRAAFEADLVDFVFGRINRTLKTIATN